MPNIQNIASENQTSLLIANRNEKYFLGDRKTFMQELQSKVQKITTDLADPNTTSIVVDGITIEDKNTPGALFQIQTKLSDLKSLNQTIMQTFDFIKETEKQVSQMISA